MNCCNLPPGPFDPALNYDDPSLDFFAAKTKIVEEFQKRFPDQVEFMQTEAFQFLVEQWSHAADQLSLLGAKK